MGITVPATAAVETAGALPAVATGPVLVLGAAAATDPLLPGEAPVAGTALVAAGVSTEVAAGVSAEPAVVPEDVESPVTGGVTAGGGVTGAGGGVTGAGGGGGGGGAAGVEHPLIQMVWNLSSDPVAPVTSTSSLAWNP